MMLTTKSIKQILMLALLGAFILALAGCNTVNGFGRDMEVVGQSIQDASAQ